MPLPPTFEARLVRAHQLTPGVRELTLDRVDGAPFVFEPGQWVNLCLPLPPVELKRSYSIASAPDGSPRFQLAITHVENGPGSTYLHALEPGATLGIIGPQGFFTRPLPKAAPSLFIATGTGVTPFRSMLHAAVSARHTEPITLLLGVRRPVDLVYRDEFEGLARAHDFFRFEPTLSRPDDGWHGRSGYVQSHVRELWGELEARGGAKPHAYICGLQRMVGSVRELLRKEMGLPREQVHSERYD